MAGRSATMLVLLGLVISGLAGCGSSSSSSAWTKPGTTEEQRGRDTLSCLNSSKGVGGQIDQTRYRQCMRDLGYVEAPAK